MAHPHDLACKWCGATFTSEYFMPWQVAAAHYPRCARKPPLTPEDGATAVVGLMGMASAIGENSRVRACPHCMKHKNAWVGLEGLCSDCYDLQHGTAKGHPYR